MNRKKRIAVAAGVYVSLLIFMMAHPTFAHYVTSENGLYLRRKPSTEAEIIQKLSFGDEMKIKKENCGKDHLWHKVVVEDQIGYVHKDYVSETNPLDDMSYLWEWHITAYTATGSPCANGNMPTSGFTVACNSLDFGDEIYIKGIGFRTVEDRGPGWLGSEWCDVFCDSTAECIQFGSQYHDVYLVSKGE